MIQNLLPAPPRRKHANLVLHCGASACEFDAVARVKTPRPTETWTPIAHHQLVRTVQFTLASNQLTIGNQAHSLTHDGMRYFGLMEIHAQQCSPDYCWVLGLRNSHDKRFPAGIVAGASVFVCDNLSFSGEVKFARKHTRYINRDLPQLVGRSIGLLVEKWHHQDQRIAAYKNSRLSDVHAHDLVIRAVDTGVCGLRLIPSVLDEWREPRHAEFEPRNTWSLFNAFTESLKQGCLAELPKRTEALHGLLDAAVGLLS